MMGVSTTEKEMRYLHFFPGNRPHSPVVILGSIIAKTGKNVKKTSVIGTSKIRVKKIDGTVYMRNVSHFGSEMKQVEDGE